MTNQVYSQSVITFDGQDDYIDFGKNDFGGVFAQGSSAFTISGWVNPHQLTDKATTYGTRNVFFARSSDRYSDNFEFGISESGNLDVFIDETNEKKIKSFGNGELTVGQWHFLAIVFNKGQLSIYLDDHEYFGYFTGDSLNKATSSVTLGATLHNNVFFTGQLANISVWNYPCPPVEIERHRSQPLVGNEQGLVAYWALNEGQGTTVKDQTVNGHNGNLRGKPNWDLAQIPFGITQSSDESERQDQLASSSEEGNLTETVVLQEESLIAGVLAAEVIAASETELQQDAVEVVSIVETGIPIEPTTVNPKAKKGTKRQSEKSAKIQTTEPKAEKSETVAVDIQQQEQPQTSTQERSQKTMNAKANPKYKILAIDGGGIRGIIPALLLAEIEKRTQKQIFNLFDLISGTSSGGILALGLTKPRLDLEIVDSLPAAQYSAEDLVQIYLEYGAEIFYEPFWEQVLGQLEDIFVQPKYSSEGREEIIRQYFGDTPLENNLKEVFVTSYDIEQRIPIFFTNKLERQQTESKKFRKLCGGFTLTDAALATSATPTYFAPYRVASSHNSNGFYTLVDGGVVANNPANLAILEAQISRQENQQVLNTEDILLVSLGTGSLTSTYSYDEVKKWGLLQWAKPLLNIVLDGGSEVVAGELERLFEANSKGKKNPYYRFQTFLKTELESIDNAKPENLRQLQILANTLIQEKSKEIDELCSILTT
ncbi:MULTISPECIES: patatin-like phospholipase family protein [unclassified Nostoc]|uniref:patatin-like phospholipase family protein n=1 Tax=unclassified Nostoc TaxID=2593658 RepID=UPI002AD26C66|nr:patatin-like phospholipase family protein [Nostoc sp. DedQUE03]MDZ7974935.1 patatin-like phospholipase family protein [Nostoc sp. DedQUE03]MDZ8048495.1 patatin-like phospholipase family protein [Nostoc sp. DedQUE02]